MNKNRVIIERVLAGVLGIILLAVGMLNACCSKQKRSEGTRLIVPGAGACEVILGLLAAEFNKRYPDIEVMVPKSTGSSGGIKKAGEGEDILGRVARPLNQEEAQFSLSYLIFAKDAVVFAVSDNVAVDSLTETQLAGIYSGKITDWNEVGGAEGPIHVFIREPNGASWRDIHENLALFKDLTVTNTARMAHHEYEMAEMLDKYLNSIGMLTYSSLIDSKSIKPIALNGIVASRENILADRYSLFVEYAFVYHEKKLNKPTEMFIDFVFSDVGQNILRSHGLVGVSR